MTKKTMPDNTVGLILGIFVIVVIFIAVVNHTNW